VRDRATVRPARHQDHVGAQGADSLDLLVLLAPIVHGDDVHDDRARAQGRPLGRLGAHGLDDARDGHLQTAARRRCAEVQVYAAAVGPLGRDDLAVLVQNRVSR